MLRFFQTGLTHDFRQKLQISSLLVFAPNELWNSDQLMIIQLVKKGLLNYNNTEFTELPNYIFPKGLTHDFGQKLEFFSAGLKNIDLTQWKCWGSPGG